MAVFSPQPLNKNDLGGGGIFVIKVTPQEESNVKMRNFCKFLQWILKDDDVYFQKITAS